MENQYEEVPDAVCQAHGKNIYKVCTVDGQFLCSQCEIEHPNREHVFRSLAFIAEEMSEQLRVKMLPNEKSVEGFTQILKDLTDKFKKSNVRTQL